MMITLGELRKATKGMSDDLLITLDMKIEGERVSGSLKNVYEDPDEYLGFDEAVFVINISDVSISANQHLMDLLICKQRCIDEFEASAEWCD